MKTKIIKILGIVALSQMASCKEDTGFPEHKTKFTLTVTDADLGDPVEGVATTIVYFHVNPKLIYEHEGKTNSSGKHTVENYSIGVFIAEAQKNGYYSAFTDEIRFEGPDYMAPKKADYSMSLRKIIKPIALYAKQIDTPIPDNGKWIGFDLEKADWVKPYGKGVCNDVEFFLSSAPTHVNRETVEEQNNLLGRILKEHSENAKQKSSYIESRDQFYDLPKGSSTYDDALKFRLYKWEGTVQMRIPHAKGGVIAEKEKYLFYNKSPQVHYIHDIAPEMRMPHHAPKDGYQKEYKWEKSTKDGSAIDEKLGFFIKTRVKLDEKGNEISAHYAKFITDLEIDIRGRIKFTSYFNPTPNDTNLEFDLKKNLFKDLKDEEKPFLP